MVDPSSWRNRVPGPWFAEPVERLIQFLGVLLGLLLSSPEFGCVSTLLILVIGWIPEVGTIPTLPYLRYLMTGASG